MTVQEIVTAAILEKLEKGIIPWQKPWNAPAARNWKTGREYTGINRLLLGSGEYVTFKQCTEAGGHVKKGEKSSIVVFFTMMETTNPETDEIKRRPLMKYYRVFEISQCEGLESKVAKFEPLEFNPIEAAENIVGGYEDRPEIKHGEPQAYYSPMLDFVNVPEKEAFKSVEGYYSTLFHELVHSTGHAKRLNRKGIANPSFFGSEKYGREELVAEIGAAMLCNMSHIENTLDNSAAYIASWMKAIKNDPKMITTAAQQAQKAVDLMTGKKESEAC